MVVSSGEQSSCGITEDLRALCWNYNPQVAKGKYDEDSPMATPDQVLELSPNPVFVSFQ